MCHPPKNPIDSALRLIEYSNPMATTNFAIPRRSPRYKGIEPITLVTNGKGKTTMVRAATRDFSSGGLRIHSPFSLIIGQKIGVLFAGHSSDPKPCKVMWAKPAGSTLPGEAGLKFLDGVGENEPPAEEPC